MKRRHLEAALFAVAALGVLRCGFAGVVISQVYGGGGNTSATYTHDFVELFNNDAIPVSLGGWSVQYASALGSTWSVTVLPNVVVQPGGYFLIEEASGGAVGAVLPTADANGLINLSSTSGKVALSSSTAELSGICPASGATRDFVGYGSADCFDGNAAAPGINSAAADIRSTPCIDTNFNDLDFDANPPIPRNSATSPAPCPTVGFAVVQFPKAATIGACEAFPVYGQVYVAGVTDASPQPGVGITGQLGIGPDGSDPASSPGWKWYEAIPNPGYLFSGNDDEYVRSVMLHASATLDYAYRFAYGNQSYVYADGTGTTDGYSAADAGQLVVDGDVIYCDRFDDAP